MGIKDHEAEVVENMIRKAYIMGYCEGIYHPFKRDVMVCYREWIKDGMPEASDNA